MDISVIVPLLNEKESLPELVARIAAVMKENGYSYEVIMVDDGSDDGSWDEILHQAEGNSAVHGIRFRRNYGRPPCTADSRKPREMWYSQWMPTSRTFRRKFRKCTVW